jgi:AraC-like DNA-binding protein
MSASSIGTGARASACRYWRPEGLPGIELFWAAASRHQFPRHSHEAYALGAVERGAHALVARGRIWIARPGTVITVNPEDTHDGGPPAADETYTYRVIYLDGVALRRIAGEAGGTRADAPFFPEAVVSDPALARHVARLHAALNGPNSLLERESSLIATMLRLLLRHAKSPVSPAPVRAVDRYVARVRDYLEQNHVDDISLADLAALSGVSRFHLLREFRRRIGMPPHAYQTHCRLRHAKRLMLAGEPPALAAVAVGFSDQSHMIRKFKAAYGVTPGQFLGRPQ